MPKTPGWPSLMLHPAKVLGHPSFRAPGLFWLSSGLLTPRMAEPCPWSCFPASCCFLLKEIQCKIKPGGLFLPVLISFFIKVPLLCSGELQEHLLQEQTCSHFYLLLYGCVYTYSMFYVSGAQHSWCEADPGCPGREGTAVLVSASLESLSAERGTTIHPSGKSALLSPAFLPRTSIHFERIRLLCSPLKPCSPFTFFSPLHLAAATSIRRNKPSAVWASMSI